jgi:2'-5' RNA ligase
MATPTYHLWVKPRGEVYNTLAQTIDHLARELAAPVFEPHITLLANLGLDEQERLRRTSELAARLRPWPVVLTEPSYRADYFRCLFMLVDPTPPVLESHALAAKLFDRVEVEPYMPHVSLVYGSYSETRKREVIRRLPALTGTSFTVSTVCLLEARSTAPSDWREIADFPLATSPRQ